MRFSTSFFPTLKEIPADATIPSHQLMLRAGLIRPLAAGIYSFLPLGYRAIKKAMTIIREEMDAIGGQEFHLPALNPVELWEETDRLRAFGDTIFRLQNRPLVLAPTHEEVICFIARNEVRSYKDLPQIWYQIQTKFRNEARPRSGVLRSRQFTMKDSYSLDATWEGLDHAYNLHAEAYKKIYSRSGLKFFIVGASSGAMGGTGSQEFMVESVAGEDTCVLCDHCGYAANLEVASSRMPPVSQAEGGKELEEIHTPNIRTIDQLAAFLSVSTERLAKSLVYKHNSKPVLILMAGNDQLNETKLQSALGGTVEPFSPTDLAQFTGADAGSIGPIGLQGFKVFADLRLKGAKNMISGANRNDYHLGNIDIERDVDVEAFIDVRTVNASEPCPDCAASLRIAQAIEVGHIFKLGTKYSDSMGATFLDETGSERPIIMGSYGIGVERIIAAHIEQHHDESGISWDPVLAPFEVHLIVVNTDNPELLGYCDGLYGDLVAAGLEVIYDDRTGVSPGFKFNDADLLGMPLQVIIGGKHFSAGNVELKVRRSGLRKVVPQADVIGEVKKLLAELAAA